MVVLDEVAKVYRTGGREVKALSDISLHINEGEFVVLSGPSGSGKTTLLMTIGAMLRPSSGRVRIAKSDLYELSIQERARFRAENIGFVFQMFHLVPYLNVVENVVLAGGAAGENGGSVKAKELLAQLGLQERLFHKPAQLSAGEKQRTAVARALFNQPKIILADEPTGNLDPDNSAAVLGYMSGFHKRGGTVVLATHGPEAERYANRIIRLQNGCIDNSA